MSTTAVSILRTMALSNFKVYVLIITLHMHTCELKIACYVTVWSGVRLSGLGALLAPGSWLLK